VKQNSLGKFSEIITSIEFISHELRKNIEVFSCKVNLIDKANLRILEKYQQGQLVYYSYYWLTSSNELKIGWDRAHTTPTSKPSRITNIWLVKRNQSNQMNETWPVCWLS
jgi:hypothetical protein